MAAFYVFAFLHPLCVCFCCKLAAKVVCWC